MSVLDDVLAATRAGASPDAVARSLRLDRGLVDLALDTWAARGVLVRPGSSCDARPHGGPCTAASTPACAGCPLTARAG